MPPPRGEERTSMKPRQWPVRVQGDRESVVILGVGYPPCESASDMDATRLGASISQLDSSPLFLAFVLFSTLVRFFRTSLATSVRLFEMYRYYWYFETLYAIIFEAQFFRRTDVVDVFGAGSRGPRVGRGSRPAGP
jgi:hypothetical protein